MDFPSRDHALGWLAGMIDGEGCVLTRPKNSRRVTICSTDQELIAGLTQVLGLLGVSFGVSVREHANPKWRAVTSVVVSNREGLEILADALTLLHPLKSAKLRSLPSTFTRVRVDRGDLEQTYVALNLSQAETARRLGLTAQQVRDALIKHGLIRPTAARWKRPDSVARPVSRSIAARATNERKRRDAAGAAAQ